MSDQGNQRGGRGGQGQGGGSRGYQDKRAGNTGNRKPYQPAGAPRSGERRPYSPAGAAPTSERRYGKPAGEGAPAGERKPFRPDEGGERRPYKPAGSFSGERRPFKPAGSFGGGERRPYSPAGAAPSGERRYGKPAGEGAPAGERKPFRPTEGGERRPYKPAGSFSGERRPFKPAGSFGGGERRPYSPAGAAPSGERRYGKPAGEGAPAGERKPFRPAEGGERRSFKPAGSFGGGERRPYSPTGAAPSGERRPFKPAGSFGGGERRPYSPAGEGAPAGERKPFRPAEGGERRPYKPAGSFSGERRPFKPAGSFGGGERRPYKPAGSFSGERRPFKPAGSFGGGERRPYKPAGTFGTGAPRPFRAAPGEDAAPVEHTGLTPGARRVALDVLRDVHERGAYASLALQDRLTQGHLSPADRRLTTSIVYSTLEQMLQIDFALDRLMEHPTTDLVQRDILRLSACQILFHDRVPDSAAVNEGVNLARIVGMEGASGFLNGVLRNLVRGKDEIPWPKREDDLRLYLHIMGSTPLWLIDKLIAVYGEELAEQIIMHRGQSHDMVLRPNMMKLTDEAFETLLAAKAWTWRRGLAPHAYLVNGASEIALDNDYRSGNFSIQGQSSMLAAEAMQVKAGARVLDACAAPGGKACYMAETMQNTGRVYAWELHEKRAMLLQSAQRRLKLENLRISIRDASEPKPDFDGMMDAVLLDAPCTGLGVLTEKPDLKYRLKETDIAPIVANQRKLLDTLSAYVRPGGTLVYSTCSILPEENTQQVQAFLEAHPDFSLVPLPETYPKAIREQQTPLGLQLFAHRDEVEGFFIARMRRARA